MNNYTEKEIKKLQDNLLLIRKIGGWSAEEFGEMIGVSKQTISNLENKKTAMTKTQYIAIRAVLDYEIAEHPDNEALSSAVNLSLNSDNLTDENKKSALAFIDGATKVELDNKTLLVGLGAILGSALVPLATPVVTATWLTKIMKNKK
jgi:transcriptional regulator with XRE-family HTH domain